MSIDYAKVGLTAGLEIHQQLDTGKLFSRTPSLLRSDDPDYEISRRLHRVAGESGEVDAAVEHEASLDKEFIYQGYDDTISLVELDECPPQGIDQEALDEVIKICLLLGCEIYPCSQVMRKTVIDGSNTGGFQRTVLIGHSGELECSFGKVRIESVALEEDSARPVERGEKRVVYRLDRLGIPLVEITTGPDLKTGEQIKEAALKIGDILRACKVKRGIGTIRQDVNVSTKGHDRVEIKGFQEPKIMVKTVDLEIERQLGEKGGEGHVRMADSKTGKSKFLRPMPGKARMYPETDLELLRTGRARVDGLKKKLPKLREEIEKDLKKSGLSKELVDLVVKQGKVDEFNTLMKVHDKDVDLVGKMVTLWRGDFAKKLKKEMGEIEEVLHEGLYEGILEALKKKKIGGGEVRGILEEVLGGKDLEEALKVEKVDDHALEEDIMKIIKEKPGMRPNAYMGLVMAKMKGKIDAKKAMEIIERLLG